MVSVRTDPPGLTSAISTVLGAGVPKSTSTSNKIPFVEGANEKLGVVPSSAATTSNVYVFNTPSNTANGGAPAFFAVCLL